MSHTHNWVQLNTVKCLDCGHIAEINYECACYERSRTPVACNCEPKDRAKAKRGGGRRR